ncbi:TadE/TadG family type IV pilus assembly protein [Allosphingosinicella indica]|uniref:TadE-like protein n=1 Tax=Allosphingosinicella indica TaxID=941907 RepID=A0A1X7GRU2_9SPHN|nr:TadE/TadG family type IV pilus assembly protein [Allosphingosinicella indica]SMF73059.1 TadE-like protein [Allosphingosinicella indica]
MRAFITLGRFERSRNLRENDAGISFVEFALILPLFIGTMAAGLEMANLLLANMKVQRLATMTADMVAQRGASEKQISEMQLYDVLSALDIAADPLDVRERGRVIVTAVLGEDSNADGTVDVNRIKWQRFDGKYVGAVPILGCHTAVTSATLQHARALILNEAMFHAQVTYRYEPIFDIGAVEFFNVPTTITRTAAFRGRGSIFKPVLSVEGYPPKQNCTSANGL